MLTLGVRAGALLLGLSTVCEAQSRTLDLNEARINYEAAGNGRTVVLIHGWALNLREWDDQMAAMSQAYRVVRYDRRGFGKSTGFPDVSADPGDLAQLLDSLGVRSAVLVGHSAGADVAVRFALAYPARVEALVLYGGPVLFDFPIPPREPLALGDLRTIARQYGLDSMWKFIGSLPMFWNPPDRPDIAARIGTFRAAYSGRDLLEDHSPSDRFPTPRFDQVKQMPTPTMFVTGEREWSHIQLVSDSLARWMPNARKVVIAGGAHGVHLAEPARFNEAVQGFLRSLGQPSRR
jgi:pimeloyl-ACP methyl ester carboxylesterase